MVSFDILPYKLLQFKGEIFMQKKKSFAIVALLLIMSLMLAACGGGNNAQQGNQQGEQTPALNADLIFLAIGRKRSNSSMVM